MGVYCFGYFSAQHLGTTYFSANQTQKKVTHPQRHMILAIFVHTNAEYVCGGLRYSVGPRSRPKEGSHWPKKGDFMTGQGAKAAPVAEP